MFTSTLSLFMNIQINQKPYCSWEMTNKKPSSTRLIIQNNRLFILFVMTCFYYNVILVLYFWNIWKMFSLIMCNTFLYPIKNRFLFTFTWSFILILLLINFICCSFFNFNVEALNLMVYSNILMQIMSITLYTFH